MKFEVRNRYTGDVQFIAEIECDEDAPDSIKLGLAVKWAIKNRANLRCANLQDADLSVLQTDIWTVYVQPEYIRIGCQYHEAKDWFSFTDEQISTMHDEALDWWKKWKEPIKAIHSALVENMKGRE